jgi:hypothetical protein
VSQHDDENRLKPMGEARIVAALATSPNAKEWWAGLPDNMRGAIIRKTAKAFMDATTVRDIGTLSRALIAMDKLDFEREKLAHGAQPQHNHLHLHGELATMSAEELREYRNRIRRDIAASGTPES